MPASPKNPKVAALMKDALRRNDQMTISDLARVTGLTRAQVGAIVRGETQRVAPAVANEVMKRLGIPMEKFLRESGYDLVVVPQKRVPDPLADVWDQLPVKVQDGIIEIAQGAANLSDSEAGL